MVSVIIKGSPLYVYNYGYECVWLKYRLLLTSMKGKINPTTKLLDQFVIVAMETAVGLVVC